MRGYIGGETLFVLLVSALSLQAVEHRPATSAILRIQKVYVDQLGGGPTSDQMRDMVITALQNLKLFVITENPEKADAILKGSADDKIYVEEHSSTDSLGFHADAGGGESSGVPGYNSSSRQNAGAGVTQSESSRIQDRRHEAQASVRLVTTEGDVIWSTTQESLGGKFRGAMADVADKIARRLSDEVKKVKAEQETQPPAHATMIM